MFNKASLTYILFALLIVLVGSVAWQQYAAKQTQTEQVASKEFLPSIAGEKTAISEITIAKQTATTTLTKQEENWVISSTNNVAADKTAIDDLLSTLSQTTIQTTVARENTQPEIYGLADQEKLIITLKAGERLIVEVTIGKAGTIPQTFYAQRSNDPAIYLVSGNRYNIDRTTWEDTTPKSDSSSADEATD